MTQPDEISEVKEVSKGNLMAMQNVVGVGVDQKSVV